MQVQDLLVGDHAPFDVFRAAVGIVPDDWKSAGLQVKSDLIGTAADWVGIEQGRAVFIALDHLEVCVSWGSVFG